ncbi:thiol-disulfide oxidoreductase DCC family protein [Psychroserpens damuponensis]|uniref:thiol-disulfide oxidoreductase DCC family protein n=1 Tax=Psychroserpens damuponensis TaxID=943936 RepID=UPI00059173E8|nr:DCC1-like thiol-disulfide oxidoreductase family protein [Psychroserpens damuponensis]
MIKSLPKNKQLILFDGVCNLCNSSVLYVIKRDKKNKFLFAPLQSNIGNDIIKKFSIDTTKTDSILLYNPIKETLTYKSTAALLITKHLGFPTNLLAVFLITPAFIRNWVYNFIAKNRYKWYGKKESCMIPTPELKSKFIA